MARIRFPLLFLLASTALACSSDDVADKDGDGIADGVLDPNNVTVVAPTKPQGYVAGEVWDATTVRPLDGVTVTLLGGGIVVDPVQTTGTGDFGFGPIPAGATFSVGLDKDGYAGADVVNVTIDDTAGNFPTSNGAVFVGPVALLPSTGSFAVQVVSAAGAPVEGAEVTVETAVRFILNGMPMGSVHARGTTDTQGRATANELPDVRALPPRFEDAAALIVYVAPVDTDGDGVLDLDGSTTLVSGRDVRSQARPHLVVLEEPGNNGFGIVASNVNGIATVRNNTPSVLAAGEPIRVVFSGPIDRDSLLIDLKNEDGSQTVVTSFEVGALGNVLTITAADPLSAGLEYNLALRVKSADTTPVQVIDTAAPFFIAGSRADPIQVLGTFHDDGDALWGSGADDLRLVVSAPLGRDGQSPAFVVEVWVALDLNGTSTVGDAPGELPAPGGVLPAPILLNAAEPSPGNGAGASGFTRYMTPRRINLPVPIGQGAGAVDFEVHFTPTQNGGGFITTPGGREAPERVTGSAALTSG